VASQPIFISNKSIIEVQFFSPLLLGWHQERGAEKERKFFMGLVHKQLEEERAAIPRAKPYPYTTDYPVVSITNNNFL